MATVINADEKSATVIEGRLAGVLLLYFRAVRATGLIGRLAWWPGDSLSYKVTLEPAA